MEEFTLIYADGRQSFAGSFHSSASTLVILKDRPFWQKGKLNLLGGKIEKETPQESAVRELKEEAGLSPLENPEEMGWITGKNYKIYIFKIPVDFSKRLYPREEETEEVFWHTNALGDKRLMPNLKFIIPLCKNNIKGWKLSGFDIEDFNKNKFKFNVEMKNE